jgi:hypothetical protein
MPAPNPTSTYLDILISGDCARLLSLFTASPHIDDPLGGSVRNLEEAEGFIRLRQRWLFERRASVDLIQTTRIERRTVCEHLLHLHLLDKEVALPVAVVSDHAALGRLDAIRVYHSLWPLFGEHRVRPPLLTRDPAIQLSDVIHEYQTALAKGDIPAIVAAFEPDGYFREPAGAQWIYQGHAKLTEFMTHLLSTGGIAIEHCTATDDGLACAIEFNAVRFGPHPLQPQAGVAVYQRGPSGLLHAARIYDDVNVEALAA